MRAVRVLAIVLAVAAVAALAFSGPAAAGQPAGVLTYNTKVCGTDWTTVRTADSYYHVYNDDFGGRTCVNVERRHLDFQVTAARGAGFHAYPNISSGWESDRYTCTGHAGRCYRYPVREKNDGNPVTSIAGWLAPGRYDFSYDIWFNQANAHPVQDDGAEVMIWLAHPGVPEACNRVVRLSGIEWCVTGWRTSHPGQPRWNLVIYWAVTPRSSAYGLRLNSFFADAIRHQQLSPGWWLTGIDAGFELVSGGLHDNIHYYSLTGLPASGGKD